MSLCASCCALPGYTELQLVWSMSVCVTVSREAVPSGVFVSVLHLFSSLVSHLGGVGSPWPPPHSLCRGCEWDLSLSPFPLPFVLFLGSEGILSPLADTEPAGHCLQVYILANFFWSHSVGWYTEATQEREKPKPTSHWPLAGPLWSPWAQATLLTQLAA